VIVSCDAAQLEWRTAVELSGDLVGLDEIRNKLDTHSLNQQAFALPSRLISKIYLFRTIFRGSGWAFAKDPDFSHVSSSPEFWERINEKFYAKYHQLDSCHKQWAELVMRDKPIIGPLGRAWTINIPTNPHTWAREIPWTTLTNYPVQGTGADIMKIARISAYRKMKQRKIHADFITTVHDSIVVDTPNENIPAVAQTFHDAFADIIPNIKRLFGYEWKVPLTCEVKAGPNLKDLTMYP
jgi:DNA polymerase-1